MDLAPALAPRGPATMGLTGRDAVARSGPLPHSWHISSHATYDYWCLPHERVLYAGDPVAAGGCGDRPRGPARGVAGPRHDQRAARGHRCRGGGGRGDPAAPWVRHQRAPVPRRRRREPRRTGDAYPVAADAQPAEAHIARLRGLPGARLARGRFRTERVTAVPMEPRGCLAEVSGGPAPTACTAARRSRSWSSASWSRRSGWPSPMSRSSRPMSAAGSASRLLSRARRSPSA